jgi:hypothetical protein
MKVRRRRRRAARRGAARRPHHPRPSGIRKPRRRPQQPWLPHTLPLRPRQQHSACAQPDAQAAARCAPAGAAAACAHGPSAFRKLQRVVGCAPQTGGHAQVRGAAPRPGSPGATPLPCPAPAAPQVSHKGRLAGDKDARLEQLSWRVWGMKRKKAMLADQNAQARALGSLGAGACARGGAGRPRGVVPRA